MTYLIVGGLAMGAAAEVVCGVLCYRQWRSLARESKALDAALKRYRDKLLWTATLEESEEMEHTPLARIALTKRQA